MNRLALAVALLCPAVPALADCAASAPREAKLPAAGIERVRIVARAGSLLVTGRAAATAIEASGLACAGDQDELAGLRLRAEVLGAEARITVEMPEGGWTFGWSSERRLDLEVTVPAGLPLEIEDTSGSVEIADTAAVRLQDQSGELRLRRIAGDVEIRDGSGAIDVEEVRGSVRIVEDGSGEIRVERVDGDVVVRDDGSGDIDIGRVKGSVRIDEDGSGGIHVRDVGGDFEVGRDGSGGITHDGVKGRVRVPTRGRHRE